MFLRQFRRFERCSYHLIESVTTYGESQCVEDKEWCCVTTDTIRLQIEKERAENKVAHWLMHFFDFSKLFVQLYN